MSLSCAKPSRPTVCYKRFSFPQPRGSSPSVQPTAHAGMHLGSPSVPQWNLGVRETDIDVLSMLLLVLHETSYFVSDPVVFMSSAIIQETLSLASSAKISHSS